MDPKNSFEMIWCVLGLPLLGFLIQALLGKSVIERLGRGVGKRVMGALAVLPVAASFVIGVVIVRQLAALPEASRLSIHTLFDWMTLQSISIPFEVRIDPLSMTMVLIITGIGALIHLYATGYMAEEKEYSRFFTYLNLFIAFMLVLVLGNNLALLFIGWEGVGLCSYLLIGFWYKDLNNARAANKAFIVNRIGDWGMTLGLFLIVALVAGNVDQLRGSDNRFLSYDVLFSERTLQIFADNPGITALIAFFLFIGAMGKSAQFPLYLWLPDAMAGPTPVSALIHAATMVTAGVFLLNRTHFLFELAPVVGAIVAAIGAFTAIFAALVAFGQTDIKKVLAYSTVSQLGFMFIACGVGAFWVGMFHVTTHAFFKALLFLGSGAVIHAMAHDQDMRHYGNLRKYLPITTITMVIGWLAIAGFPLLAGFFSKEAILGNALGNHFAVVNGVNVGYWAGIVALIVAALTAAYMTRLTMLTFGFPMASEEERWRGIPDSGHDEHHQVHHAHGHKGRHGHDHGPDVHDFFYTDEELAAIVEEEAHHHELDRTHKPKEVPFTMWFPLAVLALLSVVGGYLLERNHLLQHWLYPDGLRFVSKELVHGHPESGFFAQGHMLMYASIAAALAGIIYGLVVYWKGLPKSEGDIRLWSPWRRIAGNQFGYDKAMVDTAVEGGGVLANFSWKVLDAGLIDGAVNFVGLIFKGFGLLFRKTQTGFVRAYALVMLLGGLALLGSLWYQMMQAGVLR